MKSFSLFEINEVVIYENAAYVVTSRYDDGNTFNYSIIPHI